MEPFPGFTDPKQNWSKLPHDFIQALPLVESLAEMKVILYVLRHTWGYHDDEKRISLDEFCHGRKQRGKKERIDSGTGMSLNAIKDGIRRAIEHGFIVVSNVDASDKARVKTYYALNLSNPDSGVSEVDSHLSEVDTLPSEVDPRSKKETEERNYKKEESAQKACAIPSQEKPVTTNIIPFVDVEQDIVARMPPKRETTIEARVVYGGRAKPRFELDGAAEVDAEFEAMPSASCDLAPSKQQFRDMLGALTTVCMVDGRFKQKKFRDAAARLLTAGYTPAQVMEWYGEGGDYWRCDWRGKRGDRPNLSAIEDTILLAKTGAWSKPREGARLTDSGRRLDDWIRETALAR